MRRFIIVIVLFFAPLTLYANPYWGNVPTGPGHWFYIEELPYIDDLLPIYKAGAAPIWEINDHGLYSLGSGNIYAGYFSFVGDYELIPFYGSDSIVIATFMLPPSLITPGRLIPGRLDAFHHTYGFICGCTDEDDPFPPDSVRLADGLGWWEYFSPPQPEWPYWDGYVYGMCHAHPCKIIPCPAGGGVWDKLWVYFTDSLYTSLHNIEEHEIVSGDSRLYIRAESVGSWTGVKHVRLFLLNNPDEYEIIELQDIGEDGSMIGSYESARALGLNSCDDAVVQLYNYLDGDTSAMVGFDAIVVCLPKITTSTDTMFILSDCMELNDDLDASLEFVDDNTGEYVYLGNRIDTAGYRYRSFWQANTSCDDCGQPIYRRYYPSDTTYKWWDGQTANCLTTFLRDSLSVVGGSLSVDCSGALSPLQDIDNSFLVNTDTTINDTARATKLILVDQDPSNNEFSDSLELDIMRAIAWNEWAGSNDGRHCQPYNTQWNNYWDHVISGQDTCIETLYPCENIGSSATGTMQMIRSIWECVFNESCEGAEPPGYYEISWDSLAWNWQLNLINAYYIYFTDYMNYRVRRHPEQSTWDSLCVLCDPADPLPEYPNKEDLVTYGYKNGSGKMRSVTKENWVKKMEEDDGKYVRDVRRWKYEKPWEN